MSLNILGSYEVYERLGEGAFGEVYRGIHRILGREAALKIIKNSENKTEDEERLEYFIREARILAEMNHDNIVKIYDIFPTHLGPCIAMEYIRGPDVSQLDIEEISMTERIVILAQALQGLQEAHRRGIVHRDLKPSNLLIDLYTEKIKIADFGIAFGKKPSTVTSFRSIIGSLLFMSPEQLRGEELDERSDIWSMGVVAYYIFTGQYPFSGVTEYEIGERIIQGTYIRPSQLTNAPERVDELIGKMLRVNRNERFQKCQDILNELPVKLGKRKFSIAKDLNPEELLDSVLKVLPHKSEKIDREITIRLAAKQQGITKVGNRIRHEYLKAIQRGIKRSLIAMDENDHLNRM